MILLAVSEAATESAETLAALLGGALVCWWIRGFRAGRFPVAAEPIEAIALAVLVVVSPGEPYVALFGMIFRSLFGGALLAFVRGLLYTAALLLAPVVHDQAPAGKDFGRAVGVVVACVLMRAVLRSLESSERSERTLRSLVESSTDVVTVIDANMFIRWQAGSIRSVLGHGPETYVGKPFLALVHSDDVEPVRFALSELIHEPEMSRTIAARLLTGTGDYRYVEAAVVNCLEDHNIRGLLLNIRDDTERRALARQRELEQEARAELALVNARLEAEQQRRKLEARLERAARLEAVGQLAGGVAHDFNNLLAAILNYARFVREDLPENSPLREDVEEIEFAARRGADLVRQLLLFSRREQSELEPLDIAGVIEQLEGLLRRSVEERIDIGYDYEPGTWLVKADRANVEQVVVNLVVNARDAIDESGKIEVQTSNFELTPGTSGDLDLAPGRYVRLAVRDDGAGIDEETQRHIFEPFFTTKPVGSGSGLGLATVYGIASQAGGAVSIDSHLGRGTEVTVYFPAAAASNDEIPITAAPTGDAAAATTP